MAASIKCDERPFKGRVWGGFAPPAKNRGVWGAAPPSQNRKKTKTFFIFFEKSVLKSRFLRTVKESETRNLSLATDEEAQGKSTYSKTLKKGRVLLMFHRVGYFMVCRCSKLWRWQALELLLDLPLLLLLLLLHLLLPELLLHLLLSELLLRLLLL